VQHALRAFTPDDEKALRAAARTFPNTEFYDVAETLTTLGIGEALVTVLRANGAPSPPFATRMIPPASRMGPLEPNELAARLSTPQVKRYAEAVDRDSAEEKLARGREQRAAQQAAEPEEPRRGGAPPPGTLGQILNSPLARTVAGAVTRGLMGAILGPARRRRRY
jgi:hypothetical protein